MKEVKMYRADDGKIFNTALECEAHEAGVRFARLLQQRGVIRAYHEHTHDVVVQLYLNGFVVTQRPPECQDETA